MRITDLLTEDAVLTELGRRLRLHRIARNLTQDDLAERAGIGRATVQRVEEGRSVQALSLLKLLRTLDLLDGLDAAVPADVVLPIAEVDRARKTRQRATGRRGGAAAKEPDEPWTWADEGP